MSALCQKQTNRPTSRKGESAPTCRAFHLARLRACHLVSRARKADACDDRSHQTISHFKDDLPALRNDRCTGCPFAGIAPENVRCRMYDLLLCITLTVF